MRELEKTEIKKTVKDYLEIRQTKKIYLDPSFQVGSETESRWGDFDKSKYVQSLITNMAPTSLCLVDVQACYDNWKEVGTDIPSEEYFLDLINKEYCLCICDGNNRSITMQDFEDGKVSVPTNTYELTNIGSIKVEKRKNKKDKGLNPLIVKRIYEREINITIYTDISKDEMAEVFRKINDGITLNAHHKRQSHSSKLADYIRELSKKYNSSMTKIFSPKDIRLMKGDEFLAKCLSYTNSRKYDSKALDNMYYTPTGTINTFLRKKDSKFKMNMNNYLNAINKYKFTSKSAAFDVWAMIWDYEKHNQKITDMNKFCAAYYNQLISLMPDNKTYPSVEWKKGKLVKEVFTYGALLTKTVGGNLFGDYRRDIMRGLLEKQLIEEKILIQLEDPDNRFFTYNQKFELWKKQDGICPLTNKKIPIEEILDHSKWHADHKIPFIKGGKTIIENGQLVCAEANIKKGKKYN